MVQQSTTTDLAFLFSLGVSCVYLHIESDIYDRCSRPIHWWQTASYACLVAFRLAHILGTRTAVTADLSGPSSEAVDFLLSLRHKNALPKVMMGFTWLVALPFFTFWSVLGAAWILQVQRETDCMPSSSHWWFAIIWLCLCFLWIVMHSGLLMAACVIERRVRRTEASLRAVEDEDVLARWGQVSRLSGPETAPEGTGLSPESIRALPSPRLLPASDVIEEDQTCSICIAELGPGDLVRCLPGCGHQFHRSCIDLWLVRRADCPLCKSIVCGECRV